MFFKHLRTNSTTEQKVHPHHTEISRSSSHNSQTLITTTCPNHKTSPHPIYSISYIAYGIFLGSYKAACKLFLLQNHITHVLSIGARSSDDDLTPEITVKKIQLEDKPYAKIFDILDEACQFINEGTKGNNMILVHCHQGQSRSPAVVIHYLHRYKGFPMSRAFFLVAARRPLISLNSGFKKQIVDEAMKESSTIKREHFKLPGDWEDRSYRFKLNSNYLRTNWKRLEQEMGVSLEPPEEVKKDIERMMSKLIFSQARVEDEVIK